MLVSNCNMVRRMDRNWGVSHKSNHLDMSKSKREKKMSILTKDEICKEINDGNIVLGETAIKRCEISMSLP